MRDHHRTRALPTFIHFFLVLTAIGWGTAHAQTAPPWRQPGWSGDTPAPEAESAPVEPAAAPADRAAADVGPPRLFGRDVAYIAQQDVLPGAAPCVGCLVLRADGARVVVADNAAEHPTVRTFAAYPGGALRERGYMLGHLSPLTVLLLTDDFRILATGGGGPAVASEGDAAVGDADDSLRLWNAEALNRRTPALKLRHGAPTAIAASPDGKRFAVGDATGHVTVFRDRHGRQRGETVGVGDAPVGAVAISTNGETVFAAVGRSVRALRAKPIALRDGAAAFEAAETVTALAVGRAAGVDGALFVGDAGGRVTAFDPSSGRTLWTVEGKGAIRRIRPVPDTAALLVAAEGASAPIVVATEGGASQGTLRARHAAGLVDVAVDLDTGLVSLAHRDGVIELWRLAGAPNPNSWR